MSDNPNTRLSQTTLGRLPDTVAVPRYDRGQVGQAIVHIGLGGFHRSHQALYLDDLFNEQGPQPWGICGVGLLPQDRAMAEALLPQDLLYTLIERDQRVEKARVIGAVRQYLHAPSDPEAILGQMSDPAIRIVSLTVTEGGYYLNQGSGELEAEHPNLRHDLEHAEEAPVSVYGYLAEALARRRRAGTPPFSVLSCDNLQGNGEVARRMLLSFARLKDPRLAEWIETNVAFPNCMVDRITPATTDAHRVLARAMLGGVEDAWPVTAESFRQWVVEDNFCNGRPALEAVGVQMTDDVEPYELMKIRLLNAGHQALCHFALLLGYSTADEAMADPQLHALCERYMNTVRPLIPEPPGVDLRDYQRTLLSRYANPTVKDQLARIAFDASSRIPKFVLPSAREQLQRGAPVEIFALVVAGWLRYLDGPDEAGGAITVQDPMKDLLLSRVTPGGKDPLPFLQLEPVFGAALPRSTVFVGAVRQALESLYERGIRATLVDHLGV